MPALADRPPLRNLSLDGFKIVMAAMVIGLHAGFLRDVDPTAASYFTNCLFRIAVPTFFVINGYYLERQLDGGTLRWAGRMALLYAVWMALYAPLWWPGALHSQAFRTEIALFGFYHLWYLLALLLAGLMVAALRRGGGSSRRLAVLGGVTFLGGVAIQYAGNFHLVPHEGVDGLLNSVHTYRNFLLMGFPFVVMGVLVARHEDRLPRRPLPWAIAALALLTLEWAVNYAVNAQNSVFEVYLSLVLLCPLLFLAVRNWRVMGRSRTIGLFATAVYLLHVWVLHFTYDVEMGDTLRTVMGLVVTAALAPLVVLANRRLPLL